MTTSVADLTGPKDRKADVTIELVARKQVFHLASGRRVDGYTFNGTSPGPTITVTEGQLLEVHVRNADVPDGMTVHWHGVNLPNAEDGVAGVTQNAIAAGSSYTYRFVANHAGTYWYHSHQVSHEQVLGGLFGALVVLPRGATAGSADVKDVVAVSHTYDGVRTLNGHEHAVPVEAAPGQQVRVRIVNTDNLPLTAWAGGPWRLTAIDGYAVHGPTPVSGQSLDVPAGGRAAIELAVPEDGSAVRVMIDDDTSLVVGPKGAAAAQVALPAHDLDLLGYGTPAALPFDPDEADRRFVYDIGRKPGFLDGRPGMQWTVNGHIFPDMPMFVVAEGDIVQVHVENHSGVVHPMHIHGHHAVVLARNGKPASGSPWWLDSLDVADGDSYDIAFLADNPGVWMDHCHNLTHAAQGLVTHLMYEGLTDPYRIGGRSGNEPE
jgi:FtsP/CotA-like multicopper oxidase with cupredoxin domain